MQDIIGIVVLVIIGVISIVTAHDLTKLDSFMVRIVSYPLALIMVFAMCYLFLGGVGVLFWVIAEIGIWLRDMLQWILEGVLTPYKWLFESLRTFFA